MPQVTYVSHDGKSTTLDVPVGTSVMQAAALNGIDGIVAECGGSCMCATCHVYVREEYLPKLPEMELGEDAMLDGTASPRRSNSHETAPGVPRFPSFVRASEVATAKTKPSLAAEPPAAKRKTTQSSSGATPMTSPAASKRYFEFVEGTSSKFWEISTQGNDVTVRFGRIGTNGQTKTKSFTDAAALQKHVDDLIEEKTGKGYVEK